MRLEATVIKRKLFSVWFIHSHTHIVECAHTAIPVTAAISITIGSLGESETAHIHGTSSYLTVERSVRENRQILRVLTYQKGSSPK